LSGSGGSTETSLVPVAPETESGLTVVAEAGEQSIPIPDNPGVLVKNQQDKVIELKIDPATFVDRSDHLELCDSCAAAVIRGSLYCGNCGRPMTLAAVQPELRSGVELAVSSSLRYGLGGLAFNGVPLLLLILPALFRSSDDTFLNRVQAGLSLPIVLTALLMGLLPMLFMAWRAIAKAQRASWYYNLSATPDRIGRIRGILGNALGWFNLYLAAAWVLFVVIASFVTVVDLLMHGYTPELHKALGIFIPLIVVNCIILGRSEAFASKNGIGHSLLDGLGMGLGFTMALLVLGGVREILGSGALAGIPVAPEGFRPVLLFILPPGGFIAYGLLLAGFNAIEHRRNAK